MALLPLLSTSIQQYWPDIPARSVLAAQVEQESGWQAAATLRTSRELGAGLGQFTRAYRADGSVRFDAVAELASAHPELRGWSWANAYDPRFQLAAVVLKNRTSYRAIGWAASPEDRMAMMDAAYNSGLGSVMKRRAKCKAMPGCVAGRWFGHMERSSTQSKSRVAGYGQSFADITNTHVRNVMVVRRPKYKIYFKE
ncbi:lytic murein transglycosylase [Aquitalea magnusonii]|nr:lytic murein transglycosylase [Aquitalea magnusonii]